jgi:hypothetical protein
MDAKILSKKRSQRAPVVFRALAMRTDAAKADDRDEGRNGVPAPRSALLRQ